MGEIEYEKLRLDVLQKLIEERGIECKSNKTEIIKYLIMDDDGKYIRETTYEKYGKDICLLYTSPSPRDRTRSRMPSSA